MTQEPMGLTETIQLTEILWIIPAIPGLIVWLGNYRSAARTKRIIGSLETADGRLVYAKFSVLLTRLFTIFEAGFIVVGVMSLTTSPPPESTLFFRVIIASIFISISVGITYTGFKWRHADRTIIAMSREKKT